MTLFVAEPLSFTPINDSSIPVAFEDRDEYIRRCVEARLSESELQIRALRKGLHQVVPAHLLSLFSWHDLELMACGSPEISIESVA